VKHVLLTCVIEALDFTHFLLTIALIAQAFVKQTLVGIRCCAYCLKAWLISRLVDSGWAIHRSRTRWVPNPDALRPPSQAANSSQLTQMGCPVQELTSFLIHSIKRKIQIQSFELEINYAA